MKHWFYTEDGTPRRMVSFDLEQMTQFLEEFGEKIVKVGDEVTEEERIQGFPKCLADTLSYLQDLGIDFSKAWMELRHEEDYGCTHEYIAVLYKTPAKEDDVAYHIRRMFDERYLTYKASYDNYMRWQDKHNSKKNYFVEGQQELKTLGK